jgi:hypothetical protein
LDSFSAGAKIRTSAGEQAREFTSQLYRDGGRQLMLDPKPADEGYTATFDIELNA